jgi:hypothetical protein
VILNVLLRARKVGHQISISFEKFVVVQALLSFFYTIPADSLNSIIIHQGEEVHDYSQSAKIRARGVPRVLRREGYKGLLHRGLYTIFSTTRVPPF